jgi:hypothetical protein
VLHDDGGITAAAAAKLCGEFPEALVIPRREADEKVAEHLAPYPHVQWLRSRNVRVLQLVDYFLFAANRRILALDSDVVFLRAPRELVTWHVARPDEGPLFAYSPETGWEAKGIHWLPDAVPGKPFVPGMCCGFTAVDVHAFFDLGYLEDLIAGTRPEIRAQQRFVTQMYYSLMAGRLPADRVTSLGEAYRSGRLEWLPDLADRAICHYFGSHDDADGLDSVWHHYPELRRTLGA